MTTTPHGSETICFQNAAGRLSFQPAGFVRLGWAAGRTTTEDIKSFYEQVLSLLVTTGTHKILSEHGQRAPLSGPVQQWITGSWIPRAMHLARLRHCAIVEGADPLHRLSTQSVVAASPTGLVFQRFAVLHEAEKWLLALPG